MNNIDYLTSRIKREIPIPLLKLIFLRNNSNLGSVPTTLEYRLRTDIIVDILLRDMDMVAGKEETISIIGCPITNTQTGQIIHIGMGPTGGKEIMSILDIGYGYSTFGSNKPTIASAVSEPMIVSDARVQLVGKNTAYLDGYNGIPLTTMRVILEHDKLLADINPRINIFLAELAVLATKQHLYTQGMILLKNAVIRNGEDLPYLEQVLESYSDATTMYNDKLKEYVPVSLMADRTAWTRHLRSLCP